MWEVVIGTIKGILAGAICGAITALLGYAKSSTKEDFNPKKARQTIIVGAVIGGIAGYQGWTYQQAYEWAGSTGVIVLVEYIKKAILRRLGYEV